ncbi:MAG: hypothetical protein JST92_17825 [Deltaproteobacteria bacterium]|nr:hypothetical protein [Deltaproteobacteria bacterium]
MPPINPIKILGHAWFMSKQKKLPIKFDSKYYKDRYKADMGGAPKQVPIPWFMSAQPGYKPYQETCDKIGKDFADFHDAMVDAVQFSHNMWKLQAKFKDLKVMAVAAIGSPGCLDGPELESNIKNAPMVASFQGNMAKHRDAVAKGVSKCFKDWQKSVSVTGLPWAPAGAAFPGPMMPPIPNVPMPLIACIASDLTKVGMKDDMAKAMNDALDGGLKDKDKDKQYEALHEAIAMTLSLAFLLWLPQQQVMLCMCKGPIPTFAPPVVPVGPVLNGDNLAVPGHVMA